MGKARDQIPPPVMTPPVDIERPGWMGPHDTPPPAIGDVGLAAPQVLPPVPSEAPLYKVKANAPLPSPSAISQLAARALTGGAGMAREYAAAAGELLRTADHNVNARKNAARLLRLALAHLETA